MESLLKNHAVIVLAAGKSARAGMPKGLIEVQGRPWIDRQIESLKQAGAGKIIVVLGHHREAYERVLKAHLKGHLNTQGVERVINPDPDRGPFSSLQVGLEVLGTEAQAAWVLPVDVPCPSRAVWESLEQEAAVRSTDATVPVHLGRGGHPVRLSAEFSRRLLGVSPVAAEARLDHQIHQLPSGQVARVEVSDAKVLANLNTADDFTRHAG